ncbi:MAG: PQQ-binding-like beta-propeller repeat protein [Verrucomicrobiota bacterium]
MAVSFSSSLAGDWPWWRGPDRNGVAESGQTPPTQFSETQNVKWAVPVPGRGHGSATVVGRRVFLAIAEPGPQTQSVLCLDRETGKELWKTRIHEGGWPTKSNKKGSQASTSPACDGKHVFINFWNDGAVYTTALGLDGKLLWQTKITDYKIHQSYASSPALYDGSVIVSADNKLGGAICALKKSNGEVIWKVDRPKMPNYASPILLEAAGKTQLFFTGCELVTSLDPETGEKNWEIEGATTECVTSTVTDGERIFTSGGYPKNHVAAVAADGSGKVIWENKNRVYVPSMLLKDGFLYGVMDAGIAVCWNSATGEEIWKGRLGGTFSSSPVLVDGLIYAANESGDVIVYKADPTEFEIVAKNKLGDEIYSSPTICESAIFLRIAHFQGNHRQESLICLKQD